MTEEELRKRAMDNDKIHYFTIQKELAEQIGKKLKTHEARAVGAQGVDKVILGDKVGFHWYSSSKVICSVCEISEYDSVREMLEDCGSGLLPDLPEEKREAT